MKIRQPFKFIFLSLLFALYFSGVAVFVMQTWFLIDRGFGAEKPTGTLGVLHIHSSVGIAFLVAFGYLLRSHVQTALRGRRSRVSGWVILSILCLLIVTVPGLFYFTDEDWRHSTAMIHTYVGLFFAIPFLAHWLLKK
jgi:hypothetical protein